jgi:esterase
MSNDLLPLLCEAATAAGIKPVEWALPQDRYVRLNDLRFHYLDWGNTHLPPMLLLHGIRLQAHTWDLAALLLRQNYHVIALDQRGHGDTEWTPQSRLTEDTFDLMLEDTHQFVEHLGLTQFVLVGMSMGGITAMRYAARYTSPTALCIVDIAPETLRSDVSLNDFKTQTEELERFEDFVERAHGFMPHRPLAQLRYSLKHSLKQLANGTWTWKQDQRPGAVHSTRPLADLWNDLPRINAPTLLIRGAQSNVLAASVAQRAVALLPDGKLVTIDPATHNVHSDNPKAFAAELHSFLQQAMPAMTH